MRSLLLVPLLAFVFACGCGTTWTELPPPWTHELLANEPRAQATLGDGALVELEDPRVSCEDGLPMLNGGTPEGWRWITLGRVRELRVRRPDFFSRMVGTVLTSTLTEGLASFLRCL